MEPGRKPTARKPKKGVGEESGGEKEGEKNEWDTSYYCLASATERFSRLEHLGDCPGDQKGQRCSSQLTAGRRTSNKVSISVYHFWGSRAWNACECFWGAAVLGHCWCHWATKESLTWLRMACSRRAVLGATAWMLSLCPSFDTGCNHGNIEEYSRGENNIFYNQANKNSLDDTDNALCNWCRWCPTAEKRYKTTGLKQTTTV